MTAMHLEGSVFLFVNRSFWDVQTVEKIFFAFRHNGHYLFLLLRNQNNSFFCTRNKNFLFLECHNMAIIFSEPLIKHEKFIIKAISYCISSNISSEITAEKGKRNSVMIIWFVVMGIELIKKRHVTEHENFFHSFST